MKILITGAFGYFGTALARHLAKVGHQVVAAGRTRDGRVPEKVAQALAGVGLSHCHLPLDLLLRQFRIPDATDAIVHLAGGGAPGGNLGDATAALRDNAESAAQVARCAPKGCRLLLASSIYVYGTGARPFRESDLLSPDTLYGQLKAVAEAVWRQRGGLSLRLSHIYGAGSGIDFGRDGVTERLARAAAGGAPFVMHGDGAQQLDLVHIEDACDAVALALRAESLPPALNIGGGAPVTVAELSRAFGVDPYMDSTQIGIKFQGALIQSTFSQEGRQQSGSVRFYQSFKPAADPNGVALVGGVPSAIGDIRERWRTLDISLARSVLGWAPRVSLAEGARKLIEMISAEHGGKERQECAR